MKRFEGTAELAGNLSQAVHLALNDVSSEVAFIPSGSEIFFFIHSLWKFLLLLS